MAIKNTFMSFDEIHRLFTSSKRIFFIGIGGVSMSALAEYCHFCGKEIFGYDKVRSKVTDRLEKVGSISYYSTPDNVTGMDMVIYTNAIGEDCFEYRRARKMSIPVISRANFLGYIISLHKNKIGISGMHGKSTTCAMLGHIFEYACKSPTIFCGAEMREFGSVCKFGGREWIIFEACEYQNSFLSFPVTQAGVLNIEMDHPDFFSSIEEIKSSFNKHIKDAERVFINCDDLHSRALQHRNIITYGFSPDATYRAEMVYIGTDKCNHSPAMSKPLSCFKVYRSDTLLAECTLPICGEHFIYDALCAFAISHCCGIAPNIIAYALSDFKGSRRRMELVKKMNTGSDIFEDYAHHPREISASLSALSKMGYQKILCVFQPHTFSRTHYLYKDFTSSFSCASRVIIAPVFSAREENIFELSEEGFARDCGGMYLKSAKEIADFIKSASYDCVVLMGAGDISEKILHFLN
ncbi:MAG: UDP-N-acetylmuramate--L-alanine ligase [Clostridia bacterium]|nr:UDP-N-acetylmuramate--L-alanine ligase [Clostridia bacterium]